jgi:fumarate reductase flavoprotein subunit
VETDADVIVVGGGVAGLAAAWTAADTGVRAWLVESESRVGGSSRLSGSWIQAAGTSLQRAAGIDDTPAAMLHDYLTTNRWRVEPGLARVYCEHAPAVVEWLLELGLEFGPVVRAGAEPVPRGHRARGEGEALVTALERACRARGVEFALGNRVDALLVERGEVRGVRARGEDASARAVVLASGGFARNPEMVDRLLGGPRRGPGGAAAPTMAAPGSRGDALALGAQAGAAMVGRGRALWVPQPLTPAGVVLVDPEGRRFVDESADFTTAAAAAADFGDVHFAVFDEQIRRGPTNAAIPLTPAGFLFCDAPAALGAPPLDAWVAAGDLVVAGTIADVARAISVRPDMLAATVNRYNASCAAGVDDAFEKPHEFLVPLAVPPFYAARIQPSVLIATFCGLRIDRDARVLDELGRPVPGLFAAGEAAGGVVGDVYAGHGNSITSGLVFGRIAGRVAARLGRG